MPAVCLEELSTGRKAGPLGSQPWQVAILSCRWHPRVSSFASATLRSGGTSISADDRPRVYRSRNESSRPLDALVKAASASRGEAVISAVRTGSLRQPLLRRGAARSEPAGREWPGATGALSFTGVQPENKGELARHAAHQPEPGGDAQADPRLVVCR